MSVVPYPDELPQLIVLPPDEAFRRARRLPADDALAIEGLTDDEWRAFKQALADR